MMYEPKLAENSKERGGGGVPDANECIPERCNGFLERFWGLLGGFLERFGRAFGRQGLYFLEPFGDHFPSTIKKIHPKRHPKIDAENVSKNDAKRLQNDTRMDAQIDDI